MKSLLSALLVLPMELPAFISRHFLPRYSKIKTELPNLPSSCHIYSSEQDTDDTVWVLIDLLSEASCYLKHTIIIKKHFPNYKMPAGMQTNMVPSSHREREHPSSWVFSHSDTSCQVLQPLPTDRLPKGHVRN